jgi:hypothetical protein
MSDSVLTGKAAQLLDAQVAFLLSELTGDRLVELLAHDVTDLLAIAETLVLRDVVESDNVKAAGYELVAAIGASPAIDALVPALAEALYGLEAGEEYDLGDLVDRESVSTLVATFLSMRTLHDRAMERMTESPLAAAIATKFVQQIVADFIAQNRQAAERIPGASSLFSLGQSVASRAKSVGDRAIGGFIEGATDKGAQLALKRTNNAIRELLRDPQMHDAAMELWDLHAVEPISGLRKYLTKKELRTLAVLIAEIVVAGREGPFAARIVDECVDVVFAEYGDRTLAALLAELGLTPELLTEHLQSFAQPVVAAAVASGAVERILRERLEPFFASPAVAAILG